MKILIADTSPLEFWKFPAPVIDKVRALAGPDHTVVVASTAARCFGEARDAHRIITYDLPQSLFKRCGKLEGILFLTSQLPPYLEGEKRVETEGIRGLNARSVAEHGLFLALKALRGEVGAPPGEFLVARTPEKMTAGVVGGGAIASHLIPLLAPLFGHIRVLTRKAQGLEPATRYPHHCREEFFRGLDFLFITTAYSEETRQIFAGDDFYARLCAQITLINLARGELIDEREMVAFLENNPSAQYLTDVTWPEPYPENGILRGRRQVFITPHIGGRRDDIWPRLEEKITATVGRWVRGDQA